MGPEANETIILKPMKPVYRYRMSRNGVAWRMVLWVVVMYAWLAGLYWYGLALDTPIMRWGLIGVTAVAVVLIGLAAWNWLHPATYEVVVSRDRLAVNYPGQPSLTFDLPLREISHIENRIKITHAGRRHDGHWIVTTSGETYRITTNYFSSIRAIHKALQRVAPSIGYKTVIDRQLA